MRGAALRHSILAATACLLAGCAMFAPRYDPIVGDRTQTAYEQVARFSASAELGSYTDKASFAAVQSNYADVEAQLAVAAMRAQTLPTSGDAAVKARGLLVQMIQGCSAQVLSFAKQHQTFGIQPASGATQPMMVSCDQAARAAQALKPGK